MKILLLLLLVPTLVLGQSVDSASSGSLDSAFSKPTDLTDSQMEAAKNFQHQGIKDRVIKEGCEKIDKCQDNEGFPIEAMIGKAYALMGMISGGGGMPSLTSKAQKTEMDAFKKANPGQKVPKDAVKAEGQTDYCAMGAMAWEAVGGMIQNSLQQKAQSKTQQVNDPQLQTLVNLKETHKARKTTATWQAGVYGTVTTCYVAMLAMGKAAMDTKLAIKMGGAAALAVLYLKKADKHKNAANKVQAVIDSIPKAGDCNPYTGTACFCAEKTSKDLYPSEYQEICILNNGNAATPKVALGCGALKDGKVTYDKECTCKQTNTCLKTNIKGMNASIGFGSNLMNETNKMFDMIGSGDFEEGKLREYAVSGAALAAKVKSKDGVALPTPNLTDEQKKMADALKDVMPAALANVAAASNSGYSGGIQDSAGSSSANVSKLPKEMKEKLADAISGGYRTGGGGGSEGVGEMEELTLPGMPGSEEARGGTQVLSFADQAVSKADVNNTPSTPIFDIISNRYQKSGWKKLEPTEMK